MNHENSSCEPEIAIYNAVVTVYGVCFVSCSCNCCIFILCRLFIVCVLLCIVFRLIVVLFCVMCVFVCCVLL
jgi:hypothetical protein